MSNYEYQVVPAPRKSQAPRKVKGPEAKFAATLTDVMNAMAADGWHYQRAETLPCEERQGFTGKTTKYHSVLVFRREVAADAAPDMAPAAVAATPIVTAPAPISEPAPEPQLTRAEDGPASEGFMHEEDAPASDDEDRRDETT